MANFCPNCGAALQGGAAFCPNCGAAAGGAPGYRQPYQQGAYAGNGPTRFGIPAPGYSDRVNDPELRALLQRQKKAGAKLMLLFIPLPVIGFAIYAALSDSMEMADALRTGGIFAGVTLLLTLFSALRSRPSHGYDGVVIDKFTRSSRSSDDSFDQEYVTVVRKADGGKKKIVENSGALAWKYLPVGTRFYYHPDFAFPYELYDKSQTDTLYCVCCRKANPVQADRCEKCNAPLLK